MTVPADLNLIEGLSAVAEVVIQEERGLLIPVQAVMGRFDAPVVQVMVAGLIQERAVTLGISDDFWVIVTSGLAEGEQVVFQAPESSGFQFGGFGRGAGGGWIHTARRPRPVAVGNPTMIILEGVTKVYNLGSVQVSALDGVDLSIARGEMVAVMGVSGSGKSTLMNILGCLDVPTSGSYSLDDEDVGDHWATTSLAYIRNRKVGFVFQTYNLLPRLSALANVELPLLYGPSRRHRRQRAREALERVGLGDRMRHRPAELSGGQQQRVGIARALVKEPAILLADEPTGNLDSRSSEEIIDILTHLNREEGITVIVVTHAPEIAARTNRIISMLDGRIVGRQNHGAGPLDEPAGHRTIRPDVPLGQQAPFQPHRIWASS